MTIISQSADSCASRTTSESSHSVLQSFVDPAPRKHLSVVERDLINPDEAAFFPNHVLENLFEPLSIPRHVVSCGSASSDLRSLVDTVQVFLENVRNRSRGHFERRIEREQMLLNHGRGNGLVSQSEKSILHSDHFGKLRLCLHELLNDIIVHLIHSIQSWMAKNISLDESAKSVPIHLLAIFRSQLGKFLALGDAK